MMRNDELLELYLRKTIEFCEAYDAFSIPAAMMAGGAEIKLQDVYTHLSFVEREKYESGKSPIFDRSITRYGIQNSDIDKMIAAIDAKIAELEKEEELSKQKVTTDESEKEEFNAQKVTVDELMYKAYSEENNAERIENVEFDSQKGDSDDLIQKNFRNDKNTEESNFNKDGECDSQEKEDLNWIWFLSAPGGGKTTLLKMYSLAYAYKYYVELFDNKGGLFGDRQIIEGVCAKLGIMEGACPFFISVRDLKEEDYPDVSEPEGFARVIREAIRSLVENDISDDEVDRLLSSIKKPIYIIDSVEEFSSTRFRVSFLEGLDAFSRGNKCYLSSRYREYMESVKETRFERDGVELSAKEYVIDGLTPHFGDPKDTVREFAERWYAALNRISGREKLDVDKDFLVPLYKNSNVKDLIKNPLELTSLLMISSYDSCLPSDFVKIYGRSIELWLSWNNYARYNYEDVMRQLSQVAYQMAVSENEKIVVRHDTLEKYICQSRRDLKRYYQQEWLEDKSSIDEFIQFLCRSHLVSKNTEGYDFVHRQYQAYLVAYCITTNNFSRETRRKSRLDYLEEHIREKDDFWNQIIIIIVMLDIELRDDIITTLFSLSDNSNSTDISDTNYYVSLLIQLAVMPGVNFDDYELEKLFDLIVRNDNSWRLFSSKNADLQRLFAMNEEEGNDLFIRIVVNKNKGLTEIEKDLFRDKIATPLFYCLWHCKVSEQSIYDALDAFFTNFINTNIIDMIHNSKDLTSSQHIVKETAIRLGKDSLKANDFSDCYMLIAAIMGYEGDGDPYNCVERLIDQCTFETDVIAINILVLATWLIRCNKATHYGYGIEKGGLVKYSDFILRGIVDDEHEKMRRDYLVTFSDVFSIGETIEYEESWFKETVFEYILRMAISEYRESGALFDESDGTFTKCFEHISLYPCEFVAISRKYLESLKYDAIDLIERIRNIYKKTENLINKVRAAKLLVLLSEMQYDERKSMVREIEKTAKDGKVRLKLKNDDLEKAFLQSVEQIKDYVPEGRNLIEDLDLSNFKLTLETEQAKKDTELEDFLKEIKSVGHVEEHVDYYAQGMYEEAKKQYLKHFDVLSCRNNLAYMLRRGEIKNVYYEGISYSVEELLQAGIADCEPYSLVNYALYISWNKEHYNYNTGLTFLRQYKDSGHLLEVASWWYKLRRDGEAEGYLVLMWLSDLDLELFETKEDLEKEAQKLFSNLIKY